MIGIPHNAKYKEVKEMILTSGHTRFPVYKDSLDSVIGFFACERFHEIYRQATIIQHN